MPKPQPTRDQLIASMKHLAERLGHAPSRSEFKSETGVNEWTYTKYFEDYRDFVRCAGLEPDTSNIRIDDEDLLRDWGELVRKLRHIPTRNVYRRQGCYSADVFDKHFGSWSRVPTFFRRLADGKPEWVEVLALLPVERAATVVVPTQPGSDVNGSDTANLPKGRELTNRPTYGNRMDFRGLGHEPVNEQGVVFLFGMVARELGYMVEAVQTGFPDCEAKRQVRAGKWQRVAIEFEFESRNYQDHGHPVSGCDVIVCWRHNWPECPEQIEVLELASRIRTLAEDDE